MKKINIFNVLFFFILCISNAQESVVSIDGELKKWHRVTLSFAGEQLSEYGEVNPFLDYRLNVTFKNKDKTYVVPGFYAADGNASETSAKSGNIWKVRFTPDTTGEWTYEVSFRKGNAIAVSDDKNEGEPVQFDGKKGNFTIVKSDKTGKDFRAKGRLNYTDQGYLQFAETKTYFIKGGADSPENFLGYYEFDQTPPSHKYKPHAQDWNSDDPSWQNGKGKNIIGALNYLSSKGMNSAYFLTMNVQGDGKDVWPWTDINERYRFDCSKLDQWEIVFNHMDKLGLMLHIVTQETENEVLLDIGQLGVQRKLYYRELIARFSHHLGITWNLGEENGPLKWTPKGQSDKDRKDMAKYLKTHDPYKNFVVLHTHAQSKDQDLFLEPLLGYAHLDGPSMQTHHPHEVHERTLKWINASKKTDKRWIVCQDEIGPASKGVVPDSDDPEHNEVRYHTLWGNLMAGGAGVEWYFGYKFAHNDLNCEDWRSRDILWNQTRHALDFFQTYLPFTKMHSADDLTENPDDYVFAENGHTYAVYLPKVLETKINLYGTSTKFTVKWYNPRTGGSLQNGTVKWVKGGETVSIGFPPNKDKDWVALLTTKRKNVAEVKSIKAITYSAVADFDINTSSKAKYYKNIPLGYNGNPNSALAINAADKTQRDQFARARLVFKNPSGLYHGAFITMAENDGESVYKILVNGTEIKQFRNPETAADYERVRHTIDPIYLHKNDIIEVVSKAVTNGKIPENDETAWARGRWSQLAFSPSQTALKSKLKNVTPFTEKNGLLNVEAEAYHHKTNNGAPREWYVRSQNNSLPFAAENIENHSESASGNGYIEALPDTRVAHTDKLIEGDNFYPIAGSGGIVSYKIKIENPGIYYVWGRAFSSGGEDNGLHVGVDEEWPESGARMQWCVGKNQWTWSSAQRVPEKHCGIPQTITLNFKKKDEYIISFSMREDGFELDQWTLAKDKNFIPE